MVCRANANMFRFKVVFKDFSGGPAVKNLPCNGGDAGLIQIGRAQSELQSQVSTGPAGGQDPTGQEPAGQVP